MKKPTQIIEQINIKKVNTLLTMVHEKVGDRCIGENINPEIKILYNFFLSVSGPTSNNNGNQIMFTLLFIETNRCASFTSVRVDIWRKFVRHHVPLIFVHKQKMSYSIYLYEKKNNLVFLHFDQATNYNFIFQSTGEVQDKQKKNTCGFKKYSLCEGI